MTGKEAIKTVMRLEGWSQSALADRLGKTQLDISGYLNRGKHEMRLDIFVDMITAMGCELVLKQAHGEKYEWKIDMK